MQDKPHSEFYVRTDGRQSGNLSSRCKLCVVLEAKLRCEKYPEDQAVRAAKHRAKKGWLPFDLDLHREELRAKIYTGCELTGIPFTLGGDRDWDSPSFDRIEPEKGYVYSNVRVICWALNSAFGYWGEKKFELVARAWLERKSVPC